MKVLVLYALFILPFAGFAQVVRGRILEAKTNRPVPNASVYIESSFRTTMSDSTGHFSLQSGLSNEVPIVISCVGYSSLRISNYPDTPLEIHLEPKIYQLNEVVVVDDGMTFEEKLKLFKREFLGISPAALSCVIENEDDITFKYNSRNRSLQAFSKQPLLVHNKDLGYKVSYFLDLFMVIPGSTALNANARFVDNLDGSIQDSQSVKATKQHLSGFPHVFY